MSLLVYRTVPVSTAAATQDLPASIAVDRALIAFGRLLARQAARDWLAQPETTEKIMRTRSPSRPRAHRASARDP